MFLFCKIKQELSHIAVQGKKILREKRFLGKKFDVKHLLTLGVLPEQQRHGGRRVSLCDILLTTWHVLGDEARLVSTKDHFSSEYQSKGWEKKHLLPFLIITTLMIFF